MKVVIFLFLLTSLSFSQQSTQQSRTPITMADMMIEVTDPSRMMVSTNGNAGIFVTETNAQYPSPLRGWRIRGKEVMQDYRITIEGKELRRPDVIRTRVYPHQFIREYKNGIIERVTFADSVDGLIIELENAPAKWISVEPLFRGTHQQSEYALHSQEGIMRIGKLDHLIPSADEPYPGWIAVAVSPGRVYALPFYIPKQYAENFSPGYLESPVPSDKFTVAFAAGDTVYPAFNLAANLIEHYSYFIESKRARFENLLNDSYVRTDNNEFDRAVNWAKISLSELMMKAQGTTRGIVAGLPWHEIFRPRDTFISLPGATLVVGDFSSAKELLRSFATRQDTNASSADFGRMPDRIGKNSMIGKSADATLRFTVALQEYLNYTGDSAFAQEVYPVVKRAVQGTILHAIDSLGFLTHGDADTWMNAVGPQGAWSPRGNRANDIQALWYQQLRTASALARAEKTNESIFIEQCSTLADKVFGNFQKYFVDSTSGVVYDHLNADGTPDRQLRPNQFFTIDMIQDQSVRSKILKSATEKLVYPYGIASLSQDDENFHAYFSSTPYYIPDAAYHNGVVSTWLSGPWIDHAVEAGMSDLAYQVTLNMSHQILQRGIVGTLSELLDASPRNDEQEPSLSGDFTSAMGLAEFIRTLYQSYLGVKVNNLGSTLSLKPNLPKLIDVADCNVAIGSTILRAQYRRIGDSLIVTLSSPKQGKAIAIECTSPLQLAGAPRFSGTTVLAPNSSMTLIFDKNGITQQDAQETKNISMQTSSEKYTHSMLVGMQLAAPVVRPGLKALKEPDYMLLTNSDIKHSSASATLLYDAHDPRGDDKGNGSSAYPTISGLKPGSADIRHFAVSSDAKNMYFTLVFDTLSNPRFHPECGFDYTCAAIAIDKDGKNGSGQSSVGMNARYSFMNNFAFENIIHIGNGFQAQDAKGKVLAEYFPVPEDEFNALGNTTTKSIEFSVPVSILGKPEQRWRYAVIVGLQDERIGAGIGAFRSVEASVPGKIGGKKNTTNIYDVLLPSKKK